MFCASCRKYYQDDLENCPYCGALANYETKQQTYKDHLKTTVGHGHGMGWFKFLIYFALWAGAILNIVDGLTCIFGRGYSFLEGAIDYKTLGTLKLVDVVFGLCCIILAVFQIVTRFDLARYNVLAPKMLKLCRIMAFAISVCYIIAVICVMFASFAGVVIFSLLFSIYGIELLLALAINVAIILIEEQYFKNRASFFVNN